MNGQGRVGMGFVRGPLAVVFRKVLTFGAVGLVLFALASVEGAAQSSNGAPVVVHLAASAPTTLPGQSATLLANGRWLLIGGKRPGVVSGSVSETVPASGASGNPASALTVAQLAYPRFGQTATVLPDGTVLVLGGMGADGKIVTAAEIVDLRDGETRVVTVTGLTPRTQQSATLLPSGDVLVAGGIGADGTPLSSAELLSPQMGAAEPISGGMSVARTGQQSTLLSNGDVLIAGGRDANGQPLSGVELFDPVGGTFSAAASINDLRVSTPSAFVGVPQVQAVLPAADTTGVGVDSRIAILLSTSAQLDSPLSQPVSVVGPSGAVSGKLVAAEAGQLLFFTPSVDLLPQATYTVFLQGATDRTGRAFPFSASSFTTQSLGSATVASGGSANGSAGGVRNDQSATSATTANAVVKTAASSASGSKSTAQTVAKSNDPTADDQPENEDWVPQEKNRHGSWQVLGLKGDPVLQVQAASTPAAIAAPGETAVTGSVLRYHGKPLAGVVVSIGSHSTVTDGSGRFLLTGLTPGTVQLEVDGTGISNNGRHYTKHFLRVEVQQGQTTAVPNPIYLPRVDPSTEASISSPAAQEVVLTHPAIPGLEVHIPKGAVLREFDGKIVTKVSITPIPLDRPPYPTPAHFSVYFTLQPGGAYMEASSNKAIRVIYPNYEGLAPGTRANFWNYDPAVGWQIYGQGTVSKNGKQVVPDADVGFRQIISFGMGINGQQAPPATGPAACGCPTQTQTETQSQTPTGDPVDSGTGLFLHVKTDLAIQDVIPISVTRTYRQNDPAVRAFGIGTNLSYSMWLYTGSSAAVPPEVDLILSDGSRVPYLLQSGTSLANAVWTQTSTPSGFFGSTLTSFNNSSGKGFTITFRDKTVMKFATDPPNGLLSITDRNGNALTFTVSNSSTGGQITKVTSPSGRFIQLTYDGMGRIGWAADNLGRTVSYAYDSAGRLASVTDPNGGVESYTYDTSNDMITVTDKRNNVMVTNQYDSNGRVSQQTLADGAVWKFSYVQDAFGNVTKTTVTDPRGKVRQDTFNSSGYLTQQILALGLPEQETTTIQRDGANQVLSATDSLSRTTQFGHDGFGNVTSVTSLSGTANAVTESYSYDPIYQQLTGYTDPLSHSVSLAYDWLGNLTSMTDALGNNVQLANDHRGRPVAITNALGKVTQIHYDQGDLASITDPLGRTVSVFNDAVGRTFGVSDPLGNGTRYQYDVLDRVRQITDALGGVTTVTYDQNGNVLTVQDPRNVGTHQFSYDSRNRVHTYTDPVGNVETYNYDGMGNLVSKVDRKNQTTTYAYDGLNRLTNITYADNSSITITWDAGNRPTQFVDTTNGAITRQYDGLDRLTEEVTPQGQVDYQYDAAGRRTQFTVSGLSPVTYQYDNANRLTQIAQGNTAVGLAYDVANRRTSTTLPNGIVAGYGYDDADQLLSMSYDLAATHIGDLAYTYDVAGRRSGQSGSLASLLMPASVNSASYDVANRLTSWGTTPLAYDNNGNLTTFGSSTYGWNVRDQLVSTSDGGGGFNYDAFGRRTARAVSGLTTPYLHDGLNPATVSGGLMLDGPGLDEIYARISGSATASYLTDALGSTLGLTDGSGSSTASYQYAPYGTVSKTGTDDTPFQFTGRENDGATNLYYYRARYYNPALGRFISSDPLGLGGGLNTYAYARGNPVGFSDPMGLFIVEVGTPAEIYEIELQLQELSQQSPSAASLIQSLRNNPTDIFIKASFTPNQYQPAMPCSAGVITYNPFSFAIGPQPWEVRPPEVGLAHELIHAYHDVTNTTSIYWLIEETNTVGLTGNSPYTENGVRGDYGLPQRPVY